MASKENKDVMDIPISRIRQSKNSRAVTGDSDIAGLMTSIKEVGLLQPIGVVKSGTNYDVVYGNRRFLAVQKLGMKDIKATIYQDEDNQTIDLMNLTENIQRKDVSLAEAGRYIKILKDEGMTSAEIAVKLGTRTSYVKACFESFTHVPEKYHNDIEVKSVHDRQKTPGKMTVSTSRKIMSAVSSYGLNPVQRDLLFKEAKSNDDFNTDRIKMYASAALNGSNTPVTDAGKYKRVQVKFYMTDRNYNDLQKRYVDSGEYNNLYNFFLSVLKGEESEKIKIYNLKN